MARARSLPADPFAAGLGAFGRAWRAGGTDAADVTEATLARIAALDPTLLAYAHVDAAGARTQARALDGARKAGIDLGPLMGVGVSLKDIFQISGMPLTAGSLLDVTDLAPAEGPFVRRLRRLGCVLLGKTRMNEFGRGGDGMGRHMPTPWNPCDARTKRTPGGSSSGAGVAMAAGLCGIAVGGDTGGSVRVPAALNGQFGLKTTAGRWSNEGAIALSRTFDTTGLIARTAADAALAYAAIEGIAIPQPAEAHGLRLGRPRNHFFDALDPQVAAAVEAAIARLDAAGVAIVEFDLPEVDERTAYFPAFSTAEFVAFLGRERLAAGLSRLDPRVAALTRPGFDLRGADHADLLRRLPALRARALKQMEGLDGWIMPTVIVPPPSVAEVETKLGLRDAAPAHADAAASQGRTTQSYRGVLATGLEGQNTNAANLFGFCATTTPVHQLVGGLPVGLQLMARPFAEAQALSIARLFERLFGPPPAVDVSGFL